MAVMRRTVFVLAVLLWSWPVLAAGSTTITCAAVHDYDEKLWSCSVAWTSDSSGNVSAHPFAIPKGFLASIRFTPGSTTPSDLYDVTLIDTDGTFSTGDLLEGAGSNLSATLSVLKTFNPRPYEDGAHFLDVQIANAGNAKTGTVVIVLAFK